MKESELFEYFHNIGIVPVVKIDDASKAEKLAEAMIKGGILCAEVTFRTDAAEEAIARMSKAFPEMMVGAGTVLNAETAEKAVKAGAKFIVSPGLDEGTVKWCQANGVPVTPGVSSASEVQHGINLGLSVLKLFPAEAVGGVKMVKDLGGPFPKVKFMTTGGINQKNLADYAKCPNILAVGGSWMVKADLINNEDWDEITRLCKEAVVMLQGFEFAHVGINFDNEEATKAAAAQFANFGFGVTKEGTGSMFVGTEHELMKHVGRGAMGHIGYKVNDTARTMFYLKNLGYTVDESSIQMEKGKIKNFFLNEQIGGFAVHFLQK
ncbi:MAG: bifunctional 4-hydroxy-2-oxoglutarate aldolase/2-dehydro-3-deoxy-phosphogluconate aldolase [Spirochaetales bacterium]|nr:bifunctional 4-hydroxy-2-oxoglutarate aldolase/2-dehydro-3-deoxy-phosphogluconate aldolase [Candidatus Physcosoma equi]